ncbi:MAG: hypothetical protein ACR2KX_05025 [Chitinophagaceae bacterium]
MKRYFGILLLSIPLLFSCKKENELFTTSTLSDYFPLQVGKYITYNLDSTVYINFGQKDTILKYQVKDSIEKLITDNIGRPAYRIQRYIRKDATRAWVANNTFMAIPTATTIELVENNLRFQKLKLPIKEGYTWKGNSFIDTYSLNSTTKYLDDWEYTYDSVNVPLTLGSILFNSTIKVSQRDEFLGQDPKLAGTQYAEKNYSIEKYAKGIGLVFKEFLHWEFQGAQPGRQAFYSGYGVKLTIIGHN